MTTSYVHWDTKGVEFGQGKEEDEDIKECARLINESQQRVFDTHHRSFSGTHVKTHGVVKGKMNVKKDLPEELSQSIFSSPKEYDIAMRFSTETTDLIKDSIPQPRGIGLKVFGIEGEKLMKNGPKTQDFEFNSFPAIELGNAKVCREILSLRLNYTDPEEHMKHLKKRDDFEVQDARNHGPLSHVYITPQYSQSAFRFGKYVAKFALIPSPNSVQKELENQQKHEIDPNADKGKPFDNVAANGFRQGLTDILKSKTLSFDFQVQLLENLKDQSIEDARIPWDENKYPFKTVATIIIPPQNPFTPGRISFWETKLRLNPWYGNTDLQPLGSINRVRKGVYPVSAAFRQKMNGNIQPHHVENIQDIPDD